MADSGALRQRRHKLHSGGDHSLCKPGCGRNREVPAARPRITVIPGSSAGDREPVARLLALADRLEQAHIDDPANSAVAKELRVTLQALAGGGGGRPAEDLVDRLRREWESGA